MRRGLAVLLVPLLLLVAGCVQEPVAPAAAQLPDVPAVAPLVAAHAAGGAEVPLPDVVPEFLAQTLDWPGAEPTLGVTSTGHVFYVAYEKVLRSADGGRTWEVVSTPVSSPTTLDPYLYVDPDTDRVYSDQLYLGCSYLSYSDDLGESWTTNPAACGLPVNDHQKIASGANRGAVPTTPLYPKVLYYAYNAIAGGSRVSMSYDGGLTWPVNAQVVSPAEAACNGGLHGNIVAAPDGTMYVPKRHCEGFILAKSTDSGLTWSTKPVGADAGGSECRKNADLAVDSAGHVYGVWPGKDNHMYLSTSQDAGETWLDKSLDASPVHVNMTTMPAVVAGDPGRIAIVYYGTADGARGPDEVAEDAQWHLYVTYSLDALSESPTFVTVQVTGDPVQVGPISTNSACEAPPGSRNLLDFLDAQLDAEGRLLVAYADGCIDACVDAPKMSKSRADQAAFAILTRGPSLLATVDLLDAPAEAHEHGRAAPLAAPEALK